MAAGIPPLNKWTIVVAGSIGTLVVIAIAAGILISLTPPQLLFSIQEASLQGEQYMYFGQKKQYMYRRFYTFSLSANNTSRRMEVHYSSVDTEIWIDPTSWYSAEVNLSSSVGFHVQPPRSVTKVPWQAQWAQFDSREASAQGSGGGGDWPNCTVVVIAKVWFKVGLACTRPYHIRVSCFPVNFLNQTPYANCTY